MTAVAILGRKGRKGEALSSIVDINIYVCVCVFAYMYIIVLEER